MALYVKEIPEIQGLENLKLVAGEGGLDREVRAVANADWEWAENVDVNYEEDILMSFEEGSVVFSSLLFAINNPDRITKTIEDLVKLKVAAFLYKNVIYKRLPEEALEYADEHDLPIFEYGRDIYLENGIASIAEALKTSDTDYLSETNLTNMIGETISKAEVRRISLGISLRLRKKARAYFLRPLDYATKNPNEETPEENAIRLLNWDQNRIFRNYYLNKAVKMKTIAVPFREGIMAIITSDSEEEETFDLILDELLTALSLEKDDIAIAAGGIHEPFADLDLCVREAWRTCIAQEMRDDYTLGPRDLRTLRAIIPLAKDYHMREFSGLIISRLNSGKGADLMETAEVYVRCHGDAPRAAKELIIHQNTFHYRLERIKTALESEGITDAELYHMLAMAIDIENAGKYNIR